MDAKTKVVFWLLNATKGGPTRIRLLRELLRQPQNIRRLSIACSVDYKTAQAHVEMMVKNGLLDSMGDKYGSVYFISSEYEDNELLGKLIGGENDAKKK
ncbi:MAG: ArsR family transcriptional regulator [Candidatus Micrarchaeota archaeon]